MKIVLYIIIFLFQHTFLFSQISVSEVKNVLIEYQTKWNQITSKENITEKERIDAQIEIQDFFQSEETLIYSDLPYKNKKNLKLKTYCTWLLDTRLKGEFTNLKFLALESIDNIKDTNLKVYVHKSNTNEVGGLNLYPLVFYFLDEKISAIRGFRDNDKDGFDDDLNDDCIDILGMVRGCPDSDGDGVIDSEDKCPSIRGSIKFGGCLKKEEESKSSKQIKISKENSLYSEENLEYKELQRLSDFWRAMNSGILGNALKRITEKDCNDECQASRSGKPVKDGVCEWGIGIENRVLSELKYTKTISAHLENHNLVLKQVDGAIIYSQKIMSEFKAKEIENAVYSLFVKEVNSVLPK